MSLSDFQSICALLPKLNALERKMLVGRLTLLQTDHRSDDLTLIRDTLVRHCGPGLPSVETIRRRKTLYPRWMMGVAAVHALVDDLIQEGAPMSRRKALVMAVVHCVAMVVPRPAIELQILDGLAEVRIAVEWCYPGYRQAGLLVGALLGSINFKTRQRERL